MKWNRGTVLGLVIGIVLLAIAALALAVGKVVTNYYAGSLEIVEKPSIVENESWAELPEIKEPEITSIYKEEQKEDEIINIMLCGMDARRYDTNSRSDTIILASYNKTQHTVKLVSFMRDTWVYLPERGWSRINAATAYGGTGLLINTINHNFGLDVQNYIQIKFDDFKRVIDILGGVDIELSKDEIRYINRKLHNEDKDWNNDITAEPGLVHLNGTQALWHCRNRSIGNSDFDRTERQRNVLTTIINKAMAMDLIQATQLIYDMKDYVNTNIPITTLIELGSDAIISKNIVIETSRIPFDEEFRYANKNGASVIEINIEETTAKLHEFLGYDVEDKGEVEGNEAEPEGNSGDSKSESDDTED